MKKSLLLFTLCVVTYNVNSQVICDDVTCSNLVTTSELYSSKKQIMNNPQDVTKRSIQDMKGRKQRGEVFNLECEYPSFLAFNNNGKEVVKGAKAIGTTIRIFREKSCDIAKSMLAVPISYNGDTHYAVTNYEGESVFLDKCFFILITNENYWCDGLPLEPTKYHKCKICGKSYHSQLFKAKIDTEEQETIYYNGGATGQCVNGKNHDNLQLIDIPKCDVRKGTTTNRGRN